jgi:hypothetical protein
MCGLSEQDVYQITYITMHGWEHVWADVWRKPGMTRAVEKTHPCGCCHFEEQTEDFDFERAYWAQREAQ